MPEPGEPLPLLRKIIPFISVAILIAAVYVGWVFYSRYSADHDAASARTGKEAADAKRTVDLLGGGEFKILNFYASPGAIRRGERTTVCYGVSEAKTVRIDPPIEPIQPAISRCLQVAPRKTTQYTLFAEDGKGHSATQNFTLQVIP